MKKVLGLILVFTLLFGVLPAAYARGAVCPQCGKDISDSPYGWYTDRCEWACYDCYVGLQVSHDNPVNLKYYTKEADKATVHYVMCQICDVELRSEAHTVVTYADAVAPTCTTDGSTAGTKCSVCNTIIAAPQTIAATGHTPAEAVRENEVAPTCTEEGSYDEVVYCTVCSVEVSRETKTIDATGHIEEKLEAVAPTCTESGLTEGTKCSVCDEILVAQEKIKATGHNNFSGWEVTTEPTTTQEGIESRTCGICGAKQTRTIPMLDADDDDTQDEDEEESDTPAEDEESDTPAEDEESDTPAEDEESDTPAEDEESDTPAEDEESSIVYDEGFAIVKYVEDKQETVDTITAEADSAMIYNLVLSLDLIEKLKAEGIATIVFVADNVTISFTLDIFEIEDVQLLIAELGEELAGYVVTIDPTAIDAGDIDSVCTFWAQTETWAEITGLVEFTFDVAE